MADIFHEVDEEIRRERLKKIWERYSALILAVVVLVVAGVAGWRGYEYYQSERASESGAQFEAALALAEGGKLEEAAAAFDKVAQSGTAGYRVLARLRAASVMAAGDKAAAVKGFDAIASDNSVDVRLRDLAAIRAGLILVDSAPFSEMEQRLEPQTGSSRTFRHTARELLALSAFRAKDAAAIKRWADLIVNDVESPAGMRGRIEALLALSGIAKG
ncbi:MAG: tetratricopeptide repeat protein [Pseudorhodoplanes sp.]